MGQGGACNRCTEVSLNKNAPKPLEEENSDEGEEEAGSEEEDEDAEAKKAEEEKEGAGLALQEGLKKGKTMAFEDAIKHAAELGLDEDKITMAEKKLEDHKASRRREAFEAELQDFLQTEEANDVPNCLDKLAQGKEYGVSEPTLKQVQDRIVELELMKELRPEEIEQAKQFLELCTRRFVASCVVKGRDSHWVDLESGSKTKAVLKMDLILKNFTVTGPPDGELTCKVGDIKTKRAADADEVATKKGFGLLADADRESAVAVLLPSGGPWCFIEGNKAKQDEFVVAFQVFNGLMAVVAKKKPSPPAAEAKAAKDSNLRSAAEGEEEKNADPVAPAKKEKKGASPSKKKEEKPKEEEKPPPPPPPAEDEEKEPDEEEEEASE